VCVLHCRYHEFEPTDVGVVVLPNGQRAVTYTRQSQTGHGDHREANVEIDKIIRKTKHLQVPSRARVCVCVCVYATTTRTLHRLHAFAGHLAAYPFFAL